MNKTTVLQIGDRVCVTSGNAQGKTGAVTGTDGDYVQVSSTDTGNMRRFHRSLLVALLPLEDLPPSPRTGSAATVYAGAVIHGDRTAPSATESMSSLSDALASTPLGSIATKRTKPVSADVAALLPELENLAADLRSLQPLKAGWLNEEGGRTRYCCRVSGKVVCTTVAPEELNRYRDRLAAGRVLAALERVTRYVERGAIAQFK